MKVAIEGSFKLDMIEVPEELAKELQSKLEKINSCFGDFNMSVEKDDEVEK